MIGLMLFINSCAYGFARKPPEPIVEWCLLQEDGFAKCVLKDGSDKLRAPSEMLDYMAMPLEDARIYRQFCNRRRDGN